MEPPIGGPLYRDATPDEVDALRRKWQADLASEPVSELAAIIAALPEDWRAAALAVADPWCRSHHPELYVAQAFCECFFAVYRAGTRRSVPLEDGKGTELLLPPLFSFETWRTVNALRDRVARLVPPKPPGKHPRIQLARADKVRYRKLYDATRSTLKETPRGRAALRGERAAAAGALYRDAWERVQKQIGESSLPVSELKNQVSRRRSKDPEYLGVQHVQDTVRRLLRDRLAFVKSGHPSPERPARPKRQQ
jgi:hypothetical protein